MKKVLIIHPEDYSTFFLNRIKSRIKNNFPHLVHHYNVKLNESSHVKCLQLIKSLPNDSFIIFLGHGRSDSLCGSRGKLCDVFGSSDALLYERQNEYFYKEVFIDKSSVDVLKDKNVFCLSCRSNESIATFAISSGAKSFIGFGNIPTSYEELIDAGYKNFSKDLIRDIKTEINYIIKTTLTAAIEENKSMEELVDYIRFLTRNRIANKLLHSKSKDKYLLADILYNFKHELRVFGNKKGKILT